MEPSPKRLKVSPKRPVFLPPGTPKKRPNFAERKSEEEKEPNLEQSSVAEPNSDLFTEITFKKQYSVQNFINYLKRTVGPAYTLSEFVEKFDFTGCPAFDEYIIAPKTLNGVDSIPQLHQKLAEGIDDTEVFLEKLWILKHSRPEASEFNAELHQGPWKQLVESSSKKIAIFVVLHCDIFKPKHGSWFCLSRTFDMAPYYRFQKFNKVVEKGIYVSKQDILYSRKGKEFQNMHYCPAEFADVVQRRVEKYTQIAKCGGIKCPTGSPCSINSVARFVTQRIIKLVPRQMIGSQYNQKQLENHLRETLPKRSAVSLKQLLRGVKITEIPYLKQKKSQHGLEGSVLFLHLLAKHILQLHFYITEVSGEPSKLIYYDQKSWLILEKRATKPFLTQQTPGTTVSVSGLPQSTNWRFIPKLNGKLRPIVNLKPINTVLEIPHLILNYHLSQVDGVRLNAWHEWIIKITDFKQKFPINTQFYCVKADIAACYDRINRSKVMEVVESVLDEGSLTYVINKLACIDVRNQKMKVKPLVRDTTKYDSESPPKLVNLAFERPPYTIHSGTDALSGVKRLFNETYIRINHEKAAKLSAGIPQGSACSLDLCNLVLDHLVAHKLQKYTSSSENLLMRYVDDFLLVTTDENTAKEFAQCMAAGFSEYGVQCDGEKLSIGSDKVSFLGIEMQTKTLKLLPPRSRKVDFYVPLRGNIKNVKRGLDSEMNTLLGILRTFKREGRKTPQYLEYRISRNFGEALADRLPAFMKFLKEENARKAFDTVVEQYLLPVVSNESRKFIKYSARRSYLKQLSSNNV